MSGDRIRINKTKYASDVRAIRSSAEELTALESEKTAPDAVKKNQTVPLYEEAYDYARQGVVETHYQINKITTTMTTIRNKMCNVDQQGASEMRAYRGSMSQ